MSRPRRQGTHLPPCVYQKHGAYWHVRAGKWTRLSADLGEALHRYAAIISTVQGSMPDVIDQALADKHSRVKPNTFAQYAIAAKRLKEVFAEFAPGQVRRKHVKQLMEHLRATPNMANRIRTVLMIVMDYACDMELAESNPAREVKPYPEGKRGRYLDDAEYQAVHIAARPQLAAIMDIAYLTAQRIGDVLSIRRADLTDEGILFRQQKTEVPLLVRWNPDLRGAVERAKALHGNVKALTLFHSRRGDPLSYYTVRDQWDEACKRAGINDAHLHDLRAKGITDAKRQGKDPQRLAGHTSEAMTRRYLRGKEIISADGPSFRQSNRRGETNT
jgi:integrase